MMPTTKGQVAVMKFLAIFAPILIISADSHLIWDALHIGALSTLAPITVPLKLIGVSMRCRQDRNQNREWCETADGCEWIPKSKDFESGKCRSVGILGLKKAYEDRSEKCRRFYTWPGACNEQRDCKWSSETHKCSARISHFITNTRREVHNLRSDADRQQYITKKRMLEFMNSFQRSRRTMQDVDSNILVSPVSEDILQSPTVGNSTSHEEQLTPKMPAIVKAFDYKVCDSKNTLTINSFYLLPPSVDGKDLKMIMECSLNQDIPIGTKIQLSVSWNTWVPLITRSQDVLETLGYDWLQAGVKTLSADFAIPRYAVSGSYRADVTLVDPAGTELFCAKFHLKL